MLPIKRSLSILLILVTAITATIPLSRLQAQDSSPVTISLSIPAFAQDVFSEKLLGDFQAAHPGIQVNVVTDAANTIPSATLGLDAQLKAVQDNVSAADVVYVDPNRISAESTRAGYFLDLTPLVNDDKTLNPDDFYPPLWQAFQWDKGIWALPTSTDVIVLSYKPSAFDKVGLAYPTDNWTLDDFVNAVQKLAQKDANGKVTTPGLDITPNAEAALFRSLLNESLVDTSSIPNPPALDTPAAETLLDQWNQLDNDGLIGSGEDTTAPMSVTQSFGILISNALNGSSDERSVGVLLPGGKGGLAARGFAISAGTQHAEEAYALISFLTTRGDVANLLSAAPARKSLVGNTSGPNGFTLNVTPEVQALIDKGVANGFSVADLRYTDYLSVALQDMKPPKSLDAKAALLDAETQASNNAKAASDKKGTLNIVVATPAPQVANVNGKPAINFGILAFGNSLPNQDKWNSLASDFATNDAQVGKVNITQITTFGGNNFTSKYDCFYLPLNYVPSAQLDSLLNLDPYMAADSNFDKSDVVGTAKDQVQRDNKTWAMPIILQPSMLRYNAPRFDQAGVAAPANTWTVSDFNDTLKALKVNSTDDPPFIPASTGGTHLLVLIAAYGGMPLDYRTNPVTINYTDPATVDAIRQVLDLAKKGYIKYTALGSLNFGFGGGNTGEQTATIRTLSLNGLNFRFGINNASANGTTSDKDYKPVMYPRGLKYSAISYDIGTAYISAASKYPDACYRWISTVANNPTLFSAMPARRSLINDPTIAAANGPDLTALYNQVDAVLKDPNTISIPSIFNAGSAPTAFLLQYWLYGAFDNYVLKDGDLESSLKDAQDKGTSFQQCAANLPPLDRTSQDSVKQYIKQFGDCATKVDPSLKPLFMLMGG